MKNNRKTIGIRNNNPCNIKHSSANNWAGQIGSNRNFCVFSSPLYGLRAAFVLIRNYYMKHRLRTVSEIISRWAPDGSCIERNYSRFVAQGCGITPTEKINPDDEDFMVAFVKGMVTFENGICPYDDALMRSAYRCARNGTLRV
jgi:hypothetical protein